MPSLQIRDLPDDVYQALTFRAEREHRSLAQQAIVELRRMPELLARERRRRVIAEIRATLPARRRKLDPAPESLIRNDRDR
jgi:plasmid stability protein